MSDTPAELEIPLSKTKLVLALLGSLAFVALSIWIGSIADTQTRYNPLYMKGVAIVGVAFAGLCGIYICFKVFDTRPGLIIDKEGIVDNSSAVAFGRIPWEDIVGLKVGEVAGQKFVTIEVNEPQKYIEQGSSWKRMMNAANMKMTGSPINISSNALRLKFDDLLTVLTDALETYNKAKNRPHA